jgi:hypothetical protein
MKPTYKELEEQIKEFKKRDEEKFMNIKSKWNFIFLMIISFLAFIILMKNQMKLKK